MKRIITMTALASLVLATGHAMAQPTPEREPPAERGPMMDKDQLRQRLERRLKEMEESAERTRKAIAMLDEGAAPAEVLRTVDGLLRGEGRMGPGERPMPGPGGREGGRDDDRGPGGPDGLGRGPGPRGGGMGDGPGPRGGGMGEGPGDEPGPGRMPTPEERERMMGFLRDSVPPMAERIQRLMDAEPEQGERIFARLMPQLRDAADSRRRDPEGFGIRVNEIMTGIDVLDAIRAMRLAQTKGDPGAGEEAAGVLREALSRQFEARIHVQIHEVELLEKRLRAFQEEIEMRRRGRDRMIENMMRQIREGTRPGGPPGPDRRRPPRPE